jgi:hypothetical protein
VWKKHCKTENSYEDTRNYQEITGIRNNNKYFRPERVRVEDMAGR